VLSVVDRVVLRPLPYRDADRLIHVSSPDPMGEGRVRVTDAVSIRDQTVTLDDVGVAPRLSTAGAGPTRLILAVGSPPLDVLTASPGLLRVLGVRSVVGRDATDDDCRAAAMRCSSRMPRGEADSVAPRTFSSVCTTPTCRTSFPHRSPCVLSARAAARLSPAGEEPDRACGRSPRGPRRLVSCRDAYGENGASRRSPEAWRHV
jgi:hypothetical protein